MSSGFQNFLNFENMSIISDWADQNVISMDPLLYIIWYNNQEYSSAKTSQKKILFLKTSLLYAWIYIQMKDML